MHVFVQNVHDALTLELGGRHLQRQFVPDKKFTLVINPNVTRPNGTAF
jgi:hypothetical protein